MHACSIYIYIYIYVVRRADADSVAAASQGKIDKGAGSQGRGFCLRNATYRLIGPRTAELLAPKIMIPPLKKRDAGQEV